jgi:hypothetical protein
MPCPMNLEDCKCVEAAEAVDALKQTMNAAEIRATQKVACFAIWEAHLEGKLTERQFYELLYNVDLTAFRWMMQLGQRFNVNSSLFDTERFSFHHATHQWDEFCSVDNGSPIVLELRSVRGAGGGVPAFEDRAALAVTAWASVCLRHALGHAWTHHGNEVALTGKIAVVSFTRDHAQWAKFFKATDGSDPFAVQTDEQIVIYETWNEDPSLRVLATGVCITEYYLKNGNFEVKVVGTSI